MMTKLRLIPQLAAVLMMFSCGNEPADTGKSKTQPDPLPDNSVYHADAKFTNQNGEDLSFSRFRGKPVVAAMVFTNCEFACPAITQDIKEIQNNLPEQMKDDVHFVLISFDTKRDTAAALRAFAEKMKLDDRWTLLHGSEADVRQFSMLLDVSYKDVGGGIFSHDNVIHLLSSNGVILARSEGLGNKNEKLLATLKEL